MTRNHEYLKRRGELVMVWAYTIEANGFRSKVLVRGTATEAREYVHSELTGVGIVSYTALSDRETEAAGVLGIPVYIAPEL